MSDKPENHMFISDKEKDYLIRETSKISHPINQVSLFLELSLIYFRRLKSSIRVLKIGTQC